MIPITMMVLIMILLLTTTTTTTNDSHTTTTTTTNVNNNDREGLVITPSQPRQIETSSNLVKKPVDSTLRTRLKPR